MAKKSPVLMGRKLVNEYRMHSFKFDTMPHLPLEDVGKTLRIIARDYHAADQDRGNGGTSKNVPGGLLRRWSATS